MTSTCSRRQRFDIKHTEICVGNIDPGTEPNSLIAYFKQYGNITRYNFTSSTGGFVFITYEDPSMVDKCMNNRPHYLGERTLYVKRALPIDDDHPKERFETTRDLMIVVDFDPKDLDVNVFIRELEDYFSSYGRIYATKYCQETNFDYFLVEFGDKDTVDRIILDKPHSYYQHELNVMKYIVSNIEIMNKKYESENRKSFSVRDNIKSDCYDNVKSMAKESNGEIDFVAEVCDLQNVLKNLGKDFTQKHEMLEDEFKKKLNQINDEFIQINYTKDELEKKYNTLLKEYEQLKCEAMELNEQYVAAELEDFELTSYYEQILSEEKAKTIQLENEYKTKCQKLLCNN